jgi:hypothetical protein
VYSRGPRTPSGRRDHWKYDPTLDWKIPKTGKVTLPLIGIVKTPVEFVNELYEGKLKRSRASSGRFGLGIQQTMILRYDAFGPQAFAHELLGMEWYQWNTSGSPNPRQIDPIKVVVYRDINLEEVKQLYPVVKELEQDYRYLSDRGALEYLERKIADFNDVKEDPEHKYYESLASHLSKTRQRIIETLRFPRYKK